MDRFVDPAELVDLLGDWTSGSGPLYRKLAAALDKAASAGDLRPGERMPSERELAKLLRVSRATVVAAYDDLRGRNVFDSLRGSGTRVTNAVRQRSGADGRVPGGRATSIFQRLVDGPGELISLAFAVETAAPELGDALRDLVRHDLPGLLADVGYHPRGFPPLREAVAVHYTEMGLPTVPEEILVTTGAQQALGLVTQMYLRQGSVVVVEQPSWPGCLDVFRAAGATIVAVPLDEDGIHPDGVARAFAEHSPSLLYVMPTYHNPTGALMTATRRARIGELAAKFGVPVLEDNAYAGFSAGSPSGSPGPVAAYSPAGAEILTVGSLAKALWGGLRIGWLRASTEVTERLARYKVRADLASPVLDQALAARLLPQLGEIAKSRTEAMLGRLDHLCDLLTTNLPDWRWRRPAGGSALWVELPGADARVFAQLALRHGVEIVPGAAADPTGGHDSYIRLPFTFPASTLDELVSRLRSAWHDLQRHGPGSAQLDLVV